MTMLVEKTEKFCQKPIISLSHNNKNKINLIEVKDLTNINFNK